ncbi:MAG: histidine--tRNA ligase [Candidatus Omnitrophota bacterium]
MLKALRGTKDILPQETKLWQFIEQSARDIFSIYNYKEIRTPVIEEASLFIRSIGDATDIVQKEMYVFTDRGERTIALRPEATASIVRAYIENSLGQDQFISKLFYIGPMFRSERPQKGRQRQFHQLGAEVIGSDNPYVDVEVITLAVKFLERLNIKDIELKINSLGCKKDKADLIEKYRTAVKPYLGSLCSECNSRFKKNVLRVFDCKNPDCKKIVEKVKSVEVLCPDCKDHFDVVKAKLKENNIAFSVEKKIVRGLDYYTKTVFEISQKDLGAKDAICAGGRYNDLVKEMGGKDVPAIGFAFGIERLIMAMKDISVKAKDGLDFFIVTTADTLFEEAFKLVSNLRDSELSKDNAISYEIDFENRPLKSQMKKAQKQNARFVILLGEDEIKRNKIIFKNMTSGEQEEVGYDEKTILDKIQALQKEGSLK